MPLWDGTASCPPTQASRQGKGGSGSASSAALGPGAPVLGWYRRHFEARHLSGSKGGAVTTVQRVSSDLRLNPHFHTLCLDGVYVEDEDSKLIFHPLPCLTNGDVADILQIASTRILRLLRYKGVVEDDMINADESLTESDPALATHRSRER